MSFSRRLFAILALSVCFFAHASDARVTLYLRQNEARLSELNERFWSISDPDSPSYGQFISRDEAAKYLRPDESTLHAVIGHLEKMNLSFKTSFAKNRIHVEVPEEQADSLIPEHVAPSIVAVQAKTRFIDIPVDRSTNPNRRSPNLRRRLADDQHCLADRVDPPCLRKAYGLDAYVASSNAPGQCVVVNNYFKKSDLAAFQSKYGLPAIIPNTVGDLSDEANTEASLDIQYITTTGQNVPTTWVYIDGHSDTNPFERWLTWAGAASDAEIPKVHSLSVGLDEVEFKEVIPTMNAELQALGARGVTIVFATGDSGYTGRLKYGAASPFVTAVGGVWNGDIGTEPLGVDPITTGGFSALDLNPLPPYQKEAVAHWVNNKAGARPADNTYNTSRRCVPDIAAYDAGVYIIQDGSDTPSGGTSAAAPIVAGMMASLNAALAEKGHGPLGFVNPFLYKNEDAFLDVTTGTNGGFEATEGFDPASGLGTFSTTTYKTLLDRLLAAKEKAAAGKGQMNVTAK